uniref:Chondroitin proteoglycan 4 domain-containing protein n=1 Tax=Panagrolaimus sp. JU765 TaxID=591449 RepID=A0AC34QQ45_9BILA
MNWNFFKLEIIFSAFQFVMSTFPGQDCTEPCLSQMQRDLHGMEEMPTSPGASSWSHLLHNSRNKDVMASFFQKICTSYENADHCLQDCESRSRTGVNIRQTYAGLKFICKDVKEDFFSALPCLADFEPVAMMKCQKEINQSHSTTAQFTASIANRELHSIKSLHGTRHSGRLRQFAHKHDVEIHHTRIHVLRTALRPTRIPRTTAPAVPFSAFDATNPGPP